MADSGGSSLKDKKDNPKAKSSATVVSSAKGKAPAKKAGKEDVPNDVRGNVKSNPPTQLQTDAILECLKSIQSSQLSLVKRIDDIENSFDYCEQYSDCEDYDTEWGAPVAKRSRTLGPTDSDLAPSTDSNNNLPPSRFACLSNKFKPQEICSDDIDSVLAENVAELFRKGMSDEQYDKIVKDESSARPGNCEALSEVKLNKLIWDVISSKARTNDKKLQGIETSVVKAGVFLAKTMDQAAKLEKSLSESGNDTDCDLSGIIEGCNDALALMGHANYQINMTRRDFLRPELRSEYTHLCSHSLPFSKELFGDDVSKTAKEIEDCNKMGNRLQQGQVFRGRFRGRFGFRGQFRGGRRPSYGRGFRSFGAASAGPQGDSKTSLVGNEEVNYTSQFDLPLRLQDPKRQSKCDNSSTTMDNSVMVSSSVRNVSGQSKSNTQEQESSDSPTLGTGASTLEEDESNSMSCFRNSFRSRGLSSKATAILIASWRKSTRKEYKSYISKWLLFCSKHKVSETSPSVNNVIEYLTELYEKGLGYSVLNTARSSLSALGISLESFSAGTHPLVVRFLKGVFNIRPPKARYSEVWDVNLVLNYLRKLSPVKHLTLKDLTLKMVMLMALTNAARIHTIHLLTVNSLRKLNSEFVIYVDGLLKQSRPGEHVSFLRFKAYPPDRRLCVYFVIKEYLRRTKHLRNDGESNLLISYINPHKPVSKDTVARWTKTVMFRAGININLYGPHSVRAASTSKAREKGVPIQDIIKAAGWSNTGTFHKYYSKPVKSKTTFEAAVLQM